MFTRPGEIVLDPFMGGGTTLVEACSLGRQAVGTDISSLATFTAKVKRTARLVTYRAEVTLIIPIISPGQGVLPVACFLKKRDYFVFRVGLHQ